MAKETSVSVRVDDNMKKVLEALAHGERRTLSSYLSNLLGKHVAELPKETVLEAIRNRQEQILRERKIVEQVTLTAGTFSTVPIDEIDKVGHQKKKK